MVDRRSHESVAFVPNELGHLEGNDIIGADGADTVHLDRPDGEDDAISHGGHDLGQAHPGVVVHVVKLQVLDLLLGEGRRRESQRCG